MRTMSKNLEKGHTLNRSFIGVALAWSAHRLKLTCILLIHTLVKQKFYPFEVSEDYLFFWFESCSSGCTIPKIVEYEEIDEGTFNLAFGDIDDNGRLNDSVVSNNGDMQKVLATVVQTVLTFLEIYPGRRAYFSGNSPARNRLYRAILSRDIENWSEVFEVDGILEGERVSFHQSINFEGFIIKRKIVDR
jgi:hypothetical protein